MSIPKPRRRVLVAAAVVVWGALVGSGIALLLGYKTTPGPAGAAPASWPVASRIPRDEARNTVVMFVHPRCPCTRASLTELDVVMRRRAALATLYVVFMRPGRAAPGWEHLHVHVAVFLGGLINVVPLALLRLRPGWWLTRQVVAVAQMLRSALLIHVTGGRIETHFQVFGSLAFIAFYSDWRLLPTATLVVAADHLMRGRWRPSRCTGQPIRSGGAYWSTPSGCLRTIG